MAETRKIENKFGLPETFVKMMDLEKHNEAGCLSATTLNKGTKEIILEQRHWSEMTVEVAESIWQIWGKAVHELFNSIADDGAMKEVQFEHPMGTHIITGRIDCYDVQNSTIYDWKTCSAWKIKMGDFDDWRKQGEVYAWLMHHNGIEVKKVRFVALIKDHSKTEAKKDAQYPQFPMYIYEFDVDEELLKTIEARIADKEGNIALMENREDDEIPPCTLEERWGNPPKWAVMKKGAARALKLYDDKEDAEKRAEQEGKSFYVEERKAIDRKCEGYCPCYEFCNHYKETHKEEENGN